MSCACCDGRGRSDLWVHRLVALGRRSWSGRAPIGVDRTRQAETKRARAWQEKRAAGERRELLQKKKQLFRERLRKRGLVGELMAKDDEDEADEEDDSAEAIAAVETEMMQASGRKRWGRSLHLGGRARRYHSGHSCESF